MIPINSPAQINPNATLNDPFGIKALEQAGFLIKDITPAEARPDSAIYLPPGARIDSGFAVTEAPPIRHFTPKKELAASHRYQALDEAWESDQEAYDRARDEIMAPLWGGKTDRLPSQVNKVDSGNDQDMKQVIATPGEFQFDDFRSDSSSVYSRETTSNSEEKTNSSTTEILVGLDSGTDWHVKQVFAISESCGVSEPETGELPPSPRVLLTSVHPFNQNLPENNENRAKWRLEAALKLGQIVLHLSKVERSAYFETLVRFSGIFEKIIVCYYSRNPENIPDDDDSEGRDARYGLDREKDIELKQVALFGESWITRMGGPWSQDDDDGGDEEVGPKGETWDSHDFPTCECEFCGTEGE